METERLDEELHPIDVMICDDHQLFRDGLKFLLSRAKDMHLVGEATAGEQAVSLAATLVPDVILMDIKMPGLNGIEATRQIVQTNPHIKILIVTMFEDDNWVFDAMRAGARGYLLKGASHQEMLRAIRAVSSGEAIFSASIAERLYLSTKTVRNHVTNILSKLQVADRAQAMVLAREAGLR